MKDPNFVKLVEDGGSEELAEQLLTFINAMWEVQIPSPTRRQTRQLIDILHQEFNHERNHRSAPQSGIFFWLVLKSQIKIVRSEIWLASLLIMALGLLVTLVDYGTLLALPFVLSAPVVAAIGMALIYGTDADPALEIELATPVSSRLLLLARLALVFGFDLVIGLFASAFIVETHADLAFWPLVTGWLGPMAFLSALSFFSAALSNEPSVGILVSLGLWIIFNVMRLIPFNSPPFQQPPHFVLPVLVIVVIAMTAVGLWLAGKEERQLR